MEEKEQVEDLNTKPGEETITTPRFDKDAVRQAQQVVSLADDPESTHIQTIPAHSNKRSRLVWRVALMSLPLIAIVIVAAISSFTFYHQRSAPQAVEEVSSPTPSNETAKITESKETETTYSTRHNKPSKQSSDQIKSSRRPATRNDDEDKNEEVRSTSERDTSEIENEPKPDKRSEKRKKRETIKIEEIEREIHRIKDIFEN